MKSGILHFKKKPENDGTSDLPDRASPDLPAEIDDIGLPGPVHSELDEPCWAVVSFDQIEAGGLSYKQAAALIEELDSHGVPGLCLIANEAAKRLKS